MIKNALKLIVGLWMLACVGIATAAVPSTKDFRGTNHLFCITNPSPNGPIVIYGTDVQINNLLAMGITNIAAGDANIVMVTNTGVLRVSIPGSIIPASDGVSSIGDATKKYSSLNSYRLAIFDLLGSGTSVGINKVGGAMDYNMAVPNVQGGDGQILTNNGAGNLGWWNPRWGFNPDASESRSLGADTLEWLDVWSFTYKLADADSAYWYHFGLANQLSEVLYWMYPETNALAGQVLTSGGSSGFLYWMPPGIKTLNGFGTNLTLYSGLTLHGTLSLDGNIIPTAADTYSLGGDTSFLASLGVHHIQLFDGTTDYVGISPPLGGVGTTYAIRLPDNQGANGTVMTNDGSGNTGWWNPVPSTLFVQTNVVGLTQHTYRCIFDGIGTTNLPANFFKVGQTLSLEFHGIHANGSGSGGYTVTNQVRLGSSILISNVVSYNDAVSETVPVPIVYSIRITPISVGATGKIRATGWVTSYADFGDYGMQGVALNPQTVLTTIDTTSALALSVWGATSASLIDTDFVQLTSGTVKVE